MNTIQNHPIVPIKQGFQIPDCQKSVKNFSAEKACYLPNLSIFHLVKVKYPVANYLIGSIYSKK